MILFVWTASGLLLSRELTFFFFLLPIPNAIAGTVDGFALELLITPIGGQHIYEVACLKVLLLIDLSGLTLELTMV